MPIEQVAAAMGHAPISTTLGYDRRRRRRHTRASVAVAAQVTPDPEGEDLTDELLTPNESSA